MKREFLDLGSQPIANKFLKEEEVSDEFFFDLKVVFDEETKLVSMKDFVKPELMFNEDYKYNTSLSTPMVNHFKSVAEMLTEEFKPVNVMEIGSNDGPFIRHFDPETSVCVEPCGNFADITGDMGYETYADFWNKELSQRIKSEHGYMDLIYSANCICHIQDLDDCFSAVANLLSDDGVFVFEDPSLLRMLERGSYDQIYDEHAHVFSVTALDNILKKNGLIIFDVDNLSVHGGSNRIYAKKPNIPSDNTLSPNVFENLKEEKSFGVDNFETYEIFAKRVRDSKDELLRCLGNLRHNGKKIISIGATSKSTTVFNYCGIDSSLIDCITDTTPDKQGLLAPGSHIPVVDRESVNLNDYDYAFLGAWNFKEVIANKESEFVENGGMFITHVPKIIMFS
jgi:methylation protein EvaC